MELLLVRHGESTGNRDGVMQGARDFPLTERGREQATSLARYFVERQIGWDRAITSPLERAAETARILSDRPGVLPPESDADLREISAGTLEGLDREQIVAAHPDFLKRGVEGLGDFAAYGGESYEDMQVRVERLVERLCTTEALLETKRTLLVSHGGLLFQLAKRLVCLPVPRVMVLRFGNCTATLLRIRQRRGMFLAEIAWHLPLELTSHVDEVDGGALFR